MFLWQTFKPNFFIPSKHRKQAYKAMKMHYSQGFGSKWMLFSSSLLQLYYGLKLTKSWFADGFRLVKFTKSENKIRGFQYLIYYFIFLIGKLGLPKKEFYTPNPSELGLKEFRF